MTGPPKEGKQYERIRSLGTDGPFKVEVAFPHEQGGVRQAVLLKRLRPGWPVSNQALNRFLEDSRLVAGLNHPNIVQVLDISKDQNGPVLVTEYIHGVSLAAALRQIRSGDHSLALPHALSIVWQVSSGLKAAQASGPAEKSQVHGAISPEQLMITFEGVVKCKDFGIFRLYPLDQRDSLGGPNPAYLAPEQEQGLQPNIHSDLFSLGKVFQKLLSLTAEGSAKRLPPELLQILTELLMEDPARRTQNAAILEKTLEEPVRAYGFGNAKTDRLQLGAFLRGMFDSKANRSAGATAKPGGVTDTTPEPEKPAGLLDPAAFWVSSSQAAAPEPEDLARGGQAAEEEVSGEALVVSAPVGRSKELFLPESERIVVTPKPTSGIKSSPAPPIPQEDFQKLGQKKRPASLVVAGVAAGLCLLVGILVWSLFGSREQAVTTDASIAGPVTASGDQTVPDNTKKKTTAEEKAPDPPPPSVTRTATLKLNSNPPGALVYINDQKRGVTPLTVKDSAVGTQVSIRIELEGHRPWTQTVVLDGSRQVREFTAGLLKEENCEFGTGWIYVTTVPENATVEFNGKRLPGKTPKIINDVCAGVEHEIRVQARGFRTWRKVLSVRSQKVVNLNVELER